MNDADGRRGTGDDHVRIGDADRERAISLLGVHFADGRLSVTEYDGRCRAVAGALTQGEIDGQFRDLPVLPGQSGLPGVRGNGTGTGAGMTVYSAAEIAEQHRRGANPRAGVMAVTGIAGVAVAALLDNAAAVIPLAVVAVVAVLLYVVKAGPASWYVPSPEALERARVRKMRQAQQLELEERKAQRRLKQAQIQTDALDLAHRAMGKAGRSVNNSWEQWRKRR